MKITALLSLATLLALQGASADWVVLQKTLTDDKPQELRIQIKGDRTRMDVGEEMSIIADSSSSNVAMLMHPQKMIMKLGGDSLKGLIAMAGSSLGAGEPAAKPVATGQHEKVGEHDCEIFTWNGQLGTGKFWVAKDFPHYQDLNLAQDKLMKSMGNPAAALAPQASDFPGMIIKSELTLMGKTTVTELVSVKEETVEETAFALPPDYQEMKMPTLKGK